MRARMLLRVVMLSVSILAVQGVALAGSPDGTFTMRSMGEANAVAFVLPLGNDTVIHLRDGSDLIVPPTVNVPNNVEEGSWINATVQRIDGKNIVMSLDVVSTPEDRS